MIRFYKFIRIFFETELRIAINYGQVSALGKLQSREIRDFAMAGIPIVEELGKMLGKTSAEIYDMVEAGKIGFPEVEQAFKNMSGEGGKFYNLMEKQNASVTGQISKLKDSIQLMFNEIGESSEGIIYTAIDGASKLVDSYQEVGVILAGLVSTYGLYKAALMTEAAIRPIQIADTYKVQAAALTELLNGEQAYRISQMGLVQGSAEHVAAIQAEIAATAENLKIKLAEEEVNLQSLRTKRAEAEQVWMTAKAKTEAARQELASAITNATGEAEASLQKKMALESEKQSRAALRLVKLQDQKDTAISQAIALKEKEASAEKIAAKNREIASIQAKIASARAEEIQHGRNVAAMRAEIKSGVDITANKNVQTLTNKLNTLSEQENSAATAHSGVVKQIVGSKVLIKKLSVDADTAATILNTEAEIANTTATTFLSAAKTKLITISKNLWAALAPNPYVLAASAVVALGYGIYKLATYQTEAEEAQNRLNESMLESGKASVTETRELVKLKGELSAAKKNTEEYDKVRDQIVSKYGQYYAGLKEEIDTVGLLDSTYKKLTESIMKSFGARQYDKFIKQESDRLDTVINENLTKIQDRIYSKFDDKEAAAKYFARIRSAILEGRDLDKSSLSVLDYVAGKGDVIVNRVIEGYIKNIRDAQKITTDIDKKAKERFGVDESSNKATENTTKSIKSLSDQTEDARKKVSDLKKELEDLQSGKVVKESQSKAIEEKVKEIKDAEDSLSYLVSGKSASSQSKEDKSTESATEKAKKISQELLVVQSKLSNEQIRQQIESDQKLIDRQEDGFNKQFEQNKLNYKKELQQIKEFEDEKAKERAEAILKFGKDNVPENLSEANIKVQVDTMKNDALLSFDKANSDTLKNLTDKYQSYADQRLDIEKKFNKDIADELSNRDLYGSLIKQKDEATKANQRLIKAENDLRLVKLGIGDPLLTKEEAVKKVNEALDDYNKKNKRVLDTQKKIRDHVSALAKEMSGLGNALGGTSGEIISFIGDITSFYTTASDGIEKVAQTGAQAISVVEKASVILTIISTAIQLMKQLNSILPDAFSQYEKYDEKIERINDMRDAVNEYEIAVLKANQAENSWFGNDSLRNLKDYKELQTKIFDSYRDKMLEEQAIYENKGSGGWLTNTFKSAVSWVSKITYGFDLLNKKYKEGTTAALNNLRIETRKRSSGFLGSGIGGKSQKTEDLQTWINNNKDLFKKGLDTQLFGADGMLNQELAGVILEKYGDKLVGQTKETLEELKTLTEQYNEFRAHLREYVNSLYEPLVDNMVSSIWDWFDEGKNALDSFKDYAKQTFRDIVSDMIKTILLRDVFDKFQDNIAKLYEEYSKGNLTEAQLSEAVTKETNAVMDRYKTQLPAIQGMVDTINQNIKDVTGIDLKNTDKSKGSSQTPSSGYSVSMSQDTGDKLVGIQTGSQMRLISLDQNVARIAQWNQPVSEKFNFDTIAMPLGALSQSSLRIERMMEENRNIQMQMFYKVSDIEKWSRVLPQMNEVLGQMNSKLDNI
ncbi:hypothetical protein KL86DYS2_13194 [uncultured Dysgonomonas sp.]|uniref:Tape measure protein N-terminal domain-containing protein n=1 Tax=uncultured Dysgonomonas sp. TaxID=206096 RepID=A0A212K797_9BACT|nr:tape measure protein [uncultured Dysgonomonas sp.]SBW07609.1 hypothetical protein KL86DYS2_13194 [uncultured Dysgonomonas sp.]